jgi:lysyl-tRNA synthetase class 2
MTTNSLDAVRKDKFDKLETNPFHNNHFDYNTDSNQLRVKFGTTDSLQLAAIDENFSLAGRITRIRNFGNLIFADLKDEVGNIQLMLKKDEKFKNLVDLGDIIGVTGQICKTQKGELSIRVKQ